MEAGQPPRRSPAYKALLRAGPRVKVLQQVHAHVIVAASARSLSLLTKLLTFACNARAIAYARRVFLSVADPDSFLFNSLITATSKLSFPLESLFYYRRMLLANIPPCNYTFTAVIKSCAILSAVRIGQAIHSQVLVCGYGRDPFVQAALLAFYAKTANLRIARDLFDRMPEKSVVAWNSMISGYEQNGFAREAIELFYEMRESGVKPDAATFVCVLSACTQIGESSLGSWVHEHVVRNGFNINVVLGTALINMYSRCGNIRKAREVFDSMGERNVMAWTAMISGYGTHGYGNEAVQLFHEMQARGPKPNNVTFVVVLSACSHAGLVDDGRLVYESMKEEFSLVPSLEHHVCMVDMYGRAGRLNEAYEFIRENGLKEPEVWTAILGASKMHKNFDLGVRVAEHLLSAEPENPGHYVMLSNIYALAGKMDRVEILRSMMTRKSLKKQVGYSLIKVEHKPYLFSMGDKSHPEASKIYQYLEKLMGKCRDAGYVAVPETVMHQVEEEEREFALWSHSEKLAIAFGLLKTNHPLPIRVVKNLRMCDDCHSAIKYISVVANREIIVRDKLRFHHFRDGVCSCQDYW